MPDLESFQVTKYNSNSKFNWTNVKRTVVNENETAITILQGG